MTDAIKFLDLDMATLQGASRRAVIIGTLTDAEVTRNYEPALYTKLLKNGTYKHEPEYWHDGDRFVSGEPERPLRDSDLLHAAQWRALLAFEARYFGTFDAGDSFTVTDVFHARVGDTNPIAPLFHADVNHAPGQRMYIIFSPVEALNTQFPLDDMRAQDMPASVQKDIERLTKVERDAYLTRYFMANGGIMHGPANGVALMPRDGLHRSSPHRALHQNASWRFGHMDIRRAAF